MLVTSTETKTKRKNDFKKWTELAILSKGRGTILVTYNRSHVVNYEIKILYIEGRLVNGVEHFEAVFIGCFFISIYLALIKRYICHKITIKYMLKNGGVEFIIINLECESHGDICNFKHVICCCTMC